ncbi:lipoprotein [Paractinoplanes durhamensis]|uniref:Lipoprotein n=1 Tax=Paractinoplanes durhamensis TaxID=113563 RepID=A0ABQ3YVG0_9ACTN|nr:lipoprotein [Actinoplanes durhamensis]
MLPGRPGESARVSDSDKVAAPDGSTYNVIDTTFVQMMIVHHGQAIEMASLAGTRAGDDQLRALAGRIGAAQGPEVAWMRAWLRDRGLPESDPGHDHTGMPGMQSAADLTALAGLSGPAFDRRFATMMTAHHQGAVQMAGDVLGGGSDERLREVAGEMAVEQSSEIRRIQELDLAA